MKYRIINISPQRVIVRGDNFTMHSLLPSQYIDVNFLDAKNQELIRGGVIKVINLSEQIEDRQVKLEEKFEIEQVDKKEASEVKGRKRKFKFKEV